MVSDAIYKLKKKYTYMQSRNVGGSSSACGASPECVCPADSDVTSVGGVSPDNGKEQSKQPQQNKKPPFAACILANNKDEYLKGLHGLIDGNVGKFVAMVIQAAIETKGIVRPSSTQVKDEFGNIGNISGYNNYMKVDFSKELDFKNLKDVLLELKK